MLNDQNHVQSVTRVQTPVVLATSEACLSCLLLPSRLIPLPQRFISRAYPHPKHRQGNTWASCWCRVSVMLTTQTQQVWLCVRVPLCAYMRLYLLYLSSCFLPHNEQPVRVCVCVRRCLVSLISISIVLIEKKEDEHHRPLLLLSLTLCVRLVSRPPGCCRLVLFTSSWAFLLSANKTRRVLTVFVALWQQTLALGRQGRPWEVAHRTSDT